MKIKFTRATWFALGIFFTILIVSLLVAYTTGEIMSTYDKNVPYVSLGDNVKNKTTKGHLWFEEYMAGDEGNDYEKDIKAYFINSREILETAANSGECELGKFEENEDKELNNLIKSAIKDLDLLIDFTEKRYNNHQEAQKILASGDSAAIVNLKSTGEEAGGALDEAFDKSYEAVQTDLDKLVEYVNLKVDRETRFLRILNITIIALIILIAVAVSFFVFRYQRKSEITDEENRIRLDTESLRLEKMNVFVNQLSSANFNVELNTSLENDHLANALNIMKDKLKENNEEDKRRNWTATGLAEIGEILRMSFSTETELYNNIISFTVKYLKANQGGLFILNDEHKNDVHLELAACYAYDKKKFITKRLNLNEGLVGQAYMEKDIIYMTDVPQNYVTITSGLGESTPGCILLMPLMVNDQINGVLEIASFTPFESYKIDFIRKLAESIASTLTTLKVNIRTNKLLAHTQQQAEEMSSQEEELRQNMEEMQATQEEMNRVMNTANKEKEYLTSVLEQSLDSIISINSLKEITLFNQAAENLFGYTKGEVIGKNVKLFIPLDYADQHDHYVDSSLINQKNKATGTTRELKMLRKDGTSFNGLLTLIKGENLDGINFTAFIREA